MLCGDDLQVLLSCTRQHHCMTSGLSLIRSLRWNFLTLLGAHVTDRLSEFVGVFTGFHVSAGLQGNWKLHTELHGLYKARQADA